jgi:hypothetical protein
MANATGVRSYVGRWRRFIEVEVPEIIFGLEGLKILVVLEAAVGVEHG